MPELDPAELRAFARRDWGAPARLARRARALQSVERKVALSIALYEAARSTDPEWPGEASRRRDFEHHLRLKALLTRAAEVGAR